MSVRAVISILLVALFSYIEFYNGMIWMSYEINKSEIIQKYCVNKETPEMKCEGTCHMKKMMIDEDDTDQETSASQLLPELLLFFNKEENGSLEHELIVLNETGYQNLYTFQVLNEWEQPPQG